VQEYVHNLPLLLVRIGFLSSQLVEVRELVASYLQLDPPLEVVGLVPVLVPLEMTSVDPRLNCREWGTLHCFRYSIISSKLWEG
jgi:hypothetical protein